MGTDRFDELVRCEVEWGPLTSNALTVVAPSNASIKQSTYGWRSKGCRPSELERLQTGGALPSMPSLDEHTKELQKIGLIHFANTLNFSIWPG